MKVPILLGHADNNQFPVVPEILKFDIPAKFNKTANTSFCRNSRGITFIGKENGFLAIDDERMYYSPTGAPFYICIPASGKTIYLSENDIGYIVFNALEGPVLNSLKEQVPNNVKNFYPQGISSLGGETFMATSEGVFVVSDTTLKYFFFDRLNCSLLNTGSTLFLNVNGKGLYKWSGSEFEVVLGAGYLLDIKISAIIENEQTYSLISENRQTYSLFPEKGTISNSTGNSCKICGNLLKFYIKDGLYICSDERNELSIASTYENKCTSLSLAGVLPSSELNKVFIDYFGDIWLIYDFNIFKVEYPSETYNLDLSGLINETILSTNVSSNGLYIATNQGLYLLGQESSEMFSPKKISLKNNEIINQIVSRENLVIASGNRGLYHIDNEKASLIEEGIFSFIKPENESSIVCSNESGLIRYTFNKGKWNGDLINSEITNIISNAGFENSLWLLSADKTVYRINDKNVKAYSTDFMLHSGIYQFLVYNNELLLVGDKASYSWDNNNDRFSKVSRSFLSNQINNFDLLIGHEEHLWCSKRDMTGDFTIWKISNDNMNVPYFKIFTGMQFGEVIDIDETDTYLWITGNKKLIRLDKNIANSMDHNPLWIQSVVLSFLNDNLEDKRIQQDEKVGFRKNNITFNLKSVRYLRSTDLYYRYKINHYQEEWTQWSPENVIQLDNLHERKYSFEAQSVSSLGIISEPVLFNFTISPPIYRMWYAYLLYSFLLLTVVFLIYKWRLLTLKKVEFKVEERIREKMATVLHEKEKSDKLVEDLFPKGTADEIRESGRAKSKKFEMATVLFSDIQGFTKIAEEMNPEVLIDELDKFFFHFDSVVDKYNIEKIKTIGDAYMAAGGIPVKNNSNPVEVVLAGLEMQYYMNDLKNKKTDIWDLRIGIHTGPIISGVVGHKKLSYDIWGDTVNTASRMESSGEGGKVNISGITYSLVKDYFICEYRGKLPVKYKGNIDMYFVTGLRPELSVDLHGIPNKRFFTKLQLLRLKDIEDRLFEEILVDQTLNLHFHKHDFIHKVYNQAELLSRSENLTDDELLLTQTAALLLYSGLSESYDNYEHKSVEIARNILPEYGYDDRQIERICNIILATKEPFSPQNKLEEILIDSKMEYIGRRDYTKQVKLLYLEKKSMSKEISQERLIRKQSEILKDFEFFTIAAQRLREVSAEKQIENLKSWK